MRASVTSPGRGEIGMGDKKQKGAVAMSEKNVCDLAADKLSRELEKAEKCYEKASDAMGRIKKVLAAEVGKMLIRFCYQDEAFAQAVEKHEKDLIDCINEIAKKITRDKPSLSDVEAYAEAVMFYLPGAQVSASFRVTLPNDFDGDLLFLDSSEESVSASEERQAMILDLFDTGEV